MKKIIFLFLILISYSSCKSAKRAKSKNPTTSKVVIGTNPNGEINADNSIRIKDSNSNPEILNSPVPKAINIVEYAKQFEGVRYKFGGDTKSGMDCSGLVFESFRAFNVILPRISRDMAKRGEKITLKQVETGDLLFFKTGNKRNDINHVGLVVSSEDGSIKFIHATTSAGVIVSSISEAYWDKSFTEARRIL